MPDKPKFNPNAEFEVVEPEKPAFNPDAHYEAADDVPEVKKKPSKFGSETVLPYLEDGSKTATLKSVSPSKSATNALTPEFEGRSKDSLDLYNLNRKHVLGSHPELGKNPSTLPFTDEQLTSDAPTVKAWVKNDLAKRLKFQDFLVSETDKQKKLLSAIDSDPNYFDNPENLARFEHLNARKLSKDKLPEAVQKLRDDLAFNIADIEHKNEHNKILQTAIDKNIIPVGLYNDHDVAFKKPAGVIKEAPNITDTEQKGEPKLKLPGTEIQDNKSDKVIDITGHANNTKNQYSAISISPKTKAFNDKYGTNHTDKQITGEIKIPNNEYAGIVESFKEGSTQYDKDVALFNVISDTDPANYKNAIGFAEKEFQEDSKRGTPKIVTGLPYFMQMLGNQAIPIAKSVGAGAAGTMVNPVLGADAAISVGAYESGKQTAAGAFRQAYNELRQQGEHPQSAYEKALQVSKTGALGGLAEGVAGAFVPKTVTKGFGAAIVSFMKDAAMDTGIAGLSQVAQNLSAKEQGIDRTILEGTGDNMTGELIFSTSNFMASKALGAGFDAIKSKAVINSAKNDPKDVEADLSAQVEHGHLTPEEAKTGAENIAKTRETLTKIPDTFTDEQVEQAVPLVEEKQKLHEGKDPILSKPTKDRIAEIDEHLGAIAEGKKFYQGTKFEKETGLKNGYYTEQEVKEAEKKNSGSDNPDLQNQKIKDEQLSNSGESANKEEIEKRRKKELSERVVYDREPTADDGEFSIIGDSNNTIYRINENTGRLERFDSESGLWTKEGTHGKLEIYNAKKNGFERSKSAINAKYDVEVSAIKEPVKSQEPETVQYIEAKGSDIQDEQLKGKQYESEQMSPEAYLKETGGYESTFIDQRKVDRIKQKIKAGISLDPLTLTSENGSNVGQEGRHRAEAAKQLSVKVIPVVRINKSLNPDVQESRIEEKVSELKEKLKGQNAPQKVIDAINDDVELSKQFEFDKEGIKEAIVTAGTYDNVEKKIRISPLWKLLYPKSANKHVLLHEAVHAATMPVMWDIDTHPEKYTEEQIKANKELLDTSIEYLKNTSEGAKKMIPTVYGTTNVHEFVAEFISNPDFKEWVSKNNPTTKTNIGNFIWKNILETLGIKKAQIDNEFIKNIEKNLDTVLGAAKELNKKDSENKKPASETKKPDSENKVDIKEIEDQFTANNGNKVVDNNGKPITIYHGTTADFDNFKEGAVHFTPLLDFAKEYATKTEGAKIISANVLIKNPATYETLKSLPKELTQKEQIAELKNLGYDGIINEKSLKKEIIPFSVSQIKILSKESVNSQEKGESNNGKIKDETQSRETKETLLKDESPAGVTNGGSPAVEDFTPEELEVENQKAKDEGFTSLKHKINAINSAAGTDFARIQDVDPEVVAEVVKERSEMVGISHAENSRTRSMLGMEDYEGLPSESHKKLLAEAKQRVKEGKVDIGKLMAKLRDGEPATNSDNADLAEYKSSLEAAIEKNPSKELIDKLSEFVIVKDPAGSILGKALESLKLLTFKEDNLANFLVEKMDASGITELSEKQIADQTKLYTELKEAKEKYEQAVRDLQAQMSEEKATANVRKVKTGPKRSHDDYVKERKEFVNEAREKLKKLRGTMSAAGVPYVRELVEISPVVAKMVKSYKQEAVDKLQQVSLSDLINSIHEDLKDLISGITKSDVRDIIAGQYTEQKTRNEMAAEVLDLKREARLLKQIEDARKMEPKTEPGKNAKNRRLQDLHEKLKEIQQRNKDKEPLEIKSNDEQLKAKQKSITKSIEDLTGKIKRGEHLLESEKPKPIKFDRKTILLQDRLDELQRKVALDRERDRYEKTSKTFKFYDKVMQVIGLRRLVQTALDYSMPFRQLSRVTLNPMHVKITVKFMKEMFANTFSAQKFRRMMFAIKNSEFYHDMVKDGIHFNEMDALNVDERNEEFQRSLLFKIPYLREPFLASNRVADTALNIARFELYMKKRMAMERSGITRENSPDDYKEMSKWVMNLTGRGKALEMIERSPKGRKILGNTFYGTRLMAASLNTLNPATYLNPNIPKHIKVDRIKDMAGYTATFIALALVFSAMGFKVGLDPGEADFLKFRKGDKRYDLTGGLATYIRTFLRLVKAAYTGLNPNIKEDEKQKSGAFAGKSTMTFFRNKLSPNTSYGVDFIMRKNAIGQPFDPYSVLQLYPMYVDDIKKAWEGEGATSLLTTLLPSIMGVGVMQYGSKDESPNDYRNPGHAITPKLHGMPAPKNERLENVQKNHNK